MSAVGHGEDSMAGRASGRRTRTVAFAIVLTLAGLYALNQYLAGRGGHGGLLAPPASETSATAPVVHVGERYIWGVHGFLPTRRGVRISNVEVPGLPPAVRLRRIVALDAREIGAIVSIARAPYEFGTHPLSALRISKGEGEYWFVGVELEMVAPLPGGFTTGDLRVTAVADGARSVHTVHHRLGVAGIAPNKGHEGTPA